jgi:hypothetical protein
VPPLPVAAAIAPVLLPDPPETIVREVVQTTIISVEPLPAPVVRKPQIRIDAPQQIARYSPIMRRWAAEEFRGELDDQVNPFWQ